jgi:hypothetical protein
MKKILIVALVAVAVLLVVGYSQLNIFVVQPIGAVPEGKTLIISRLNKTEFVDSADAMCERLQGGVSLMCRGLMLGAVVGSRPVKWCKKPPGPFSGLTYAAEGRAGESSSSSDFVL